MLATLLAQIVPGRMLVVSALVTAGVATGWVLGAGHEQEKAARFEGQVQGLGIAASHRAARIETRQTQLNEETNHAHAAGLDLLHAYYGRLRLDGAGGGDLPHISVAAERFQPQPADAQAAAPGAAGRIAEDGLADPALAEHCAETTLMFIDLRNAWRDQSELGALP